MKEWILVLGSFMSGALCSQPSAPSPIAATLRDLKWGQLQFLHTTDVHGWWSGHLMEPSYAADWGDYISFSKHMRDKADQENVDLLLVDTGDRVDGNGLYDGSDPKGKYTFDIAKQQNIDLICSGNHELYLANSSNNEFYHTTKDFKGAYIASNLDIYNPETGQLEPLAPRFKKFTTKHQGIRILAFGFLFDFTGNANNTVVQPVENTVEETWFKEAIRDRDIDLIVVVGHVPVRSKEYDILYRVLRSQQWDTPIVFFGGHTHIRDYKIYDRSTVALESGRYLETVGWLSIEGLRTGGRKRSVTSKTPSFSRLYLDNNLYSYYYHSNKTKETFPTEHGLNVSAMILSARKALHLDVRHGCAPVDLWVNRAPYPSPNSIYTWLEQHVLPDELSVSPRIAKDGKKGLVITNTGAMRFDILQGPFTRDTEYLVSPFTNGFRYIPDVPYSAARHVLQLLNNEGPILEAATGLARPQNRMLVPPQQAGRRDAVARVVSDAPRDRPQVMLGADEAPPGYTTTDDAGSDGDDTIHSPLLFFNVPNCIQAPLGFRLSNSNINPASSSVSSDVLDSGGSSDPERVDLIYNEFIQPWILLVLKYLGQEYTSDDVAVYMDGQSFTSIITDWVSSNWQVKSEKCP